MIPPRRWLLGFSVLLCAACGDGGADLADTPVAESMIDPGIAGLRERAASRFSALPAPEIPVAEPERQRFELGRRLFFDARLSVDGQVSCGSCHLAQYGAADGLAIAVGVAGRKSERNAPTVWNAALQSSQQWLGDRASLADQATHALLSASWFGDQDEAEVLGRLRDAGYLPAFARAFATADAALSLENLGQAIATFEATLITPGRFDDFLRGADEALTVRERAGLDLFLDTGCADCHGGAGLGGEQLARFGLVKPYEQATGSADVDQGRIELTQRDDDRFVFKVPMLRNVAETAPYFHDGNVIGLEQAVRVMLEVQLGVSLQDYEVDNLAAFLRALSGGAPQWYSEP